MSDVLVVGGGTAGCVLASRLSEDPACRVRLLEAGPDYGPLADGRWPAGILDAGVIAESHSWGSGGEDERSLGGRILGGSSAVNACMIVRGAREDYDEWGHGWTSESLAPFLDRAEETFHTADLNTAEPAPFHGRFVDAARSVGVHDARPYAANVVDGVRWNAALAYLDGARDRPNLEIAAGVLVDRVVFDGARATGVIDDTGTTHPADVVALAAGAYFSPAILARSGIGPEETLRNLGIPIVEPLPVGERLLDHHGTSLLWEPTEELHAETAEHLRTSQLFESHAVVTAASRACGAGLWDTHILSYLFAGDETGRFRVSAPVFHMKPGSAGSLSLRSTDPRDLPHVERGFLSEPVDLDVIVEGLALAREIAHAAPLEGQLAEELRPGRADLTEYVRTSPRNYFHPAGTCPIGEVVDGACRVLGVESLVVADASVMPTIPRANTNLTTAAIAERVASMLR